MLAGRCAVAWPVRSKNKLAARVSLSLSRTLALLVEDDFVALQGLIFIGEGACSGDSLKDIRPGTAVAAPACQQRQSEENRTAGPKAGGRHAGDSEAV